jgi:RNA polymerase sigma factor (sigma-70 family)
MTGPTRAAIAGRASEQLTTARVSHAVRLAQAGDREALGFLYARYADNVHGYVRSIVHDPHEAEDVTQQVFAKLIHMIGEYEEPEVPFFAWILRVARNLAVDQLRCPRMIPVEEVSAALPYRDCDASWPLRSQRARPELSRTASLGARR